jgi:LacI family transcriptional regulator
MQAAPAIPPPPAVSPANPGKVDVAPFQVISERHGRSRQVALLIETSHSYARGILRGIEDYNSQHDQWSVSLGGDARFEPPLDWLASWEGDAIIARVENPRTAAALKAKGLPVVAIGPHGLLPGAPCVTPDVIAISEMAAEHLIEHGFRRFSYCGDPRFAWSSVRRDTFYEAVRRSPRHGEIVEGCDPPTRGPDAETDPAILMRWLRALPKPVGIFACHDARGAQVVEACRRAGFRVPDEVAVLGVGNDQVLCELSQPALTSVIPNARRVGWEAARLLHLLLEGGDMPAFPLLIPPSGLATRQSTERENTQDEHVVQALRYIRQHACEGAGVSEVLKCVPLSRRQLERRFHAATGRTIGAEITGIRLAKVRELLTFSSLSLGEIAYQTGFRQAEYLSVVFKRETGHTPSEYRQLHGSPAKRPARSTPVRTDA